MIDKQKILAFIKERGPVIPRDLSKAFGGDTFLMGAVLSQMVDSKELKISFAKVGGSPAYYLPGQEDKLILLYNYLPGKEKEAFDLLKSKKIIRDGEAEPAIRVALRNIKDFAKPLEVNMPGKTELFWKWFLVANQEAETTIKSIFLPPAAETPEKKEEPKQKEIAVETEKEQHQEKQQKVETQQKIPKTDHPPKADTPLMSRIKEIFAEKEIDIIESSILRKSEIELLVRLPSPVGKLTYFCKVSDKKKINDKDLSSVFVQSQMKKLPVLYVTTGQISKKAKEMLDQEFKIISLMTI